MSLRSSHNRRAGRPKPESVPSSEEIARDVRKMKHEQKPAHNYRALSLEMHGMICAKCAREFDEKNKRELTVHHIDGNDANNPADGSNWENLCIHCHEDAHHRGQ